MSRFLVLFVTVMGCAHHAFAYDCGQLGSSHCGRDPWSPKGKCTWLGGTDGCVSAKSCSSWDANAAECRAAYPTFKSSKNSAQCRHDGSSCSNPPACNTSPYKDSEAQCKNTQGACKWDGGACKASLSSTKVCTCSNGQKVDTCTDSNKPCKNCNAGFKLSSGTCQACAAATHHQTSGQFTGSSCTAHTDCTANIQQEKTAPTATTDRVCECTAGYERKPGSNTCTKCAPTYFKAEAGDQACTLHRVPCPATGDQVEFTTPDHKTNRVCIRCDTLKGMYNGQPYNGQTVNCAAKQSVCNTDPRCASWKKLYKDSKCTCSAPAPASRR